MRHEEGTPGLAERLELAMREAGVSKRGLAVRLAGGTGDKARIENERRGVRRMLSGDQQTIRRDTAIRLSEVLGVPLDYWPTERVTERPPMELAEEVVRRLDAGEEFPREELDRLADRVEEVGRLSLALAGRLRRGGAAASSTP